MDNVTESQMVGTAGYRLPVVAVPRDEDIDRARPSGVHNPDATSIYCQCLFVELQHDTADINHTGPSRGRPSIPCGRSNSRSRRLMDVQDPAVAAQLIKDCASVNYKNSYGCTPLHVSQNVEIAALLIGSGADINCADRYGYTPLHHAFASEVAALLIDNGADIHSTDIEGNTPLHMFPADYEVDTQRMALIIEKGANIDAENSYGRCPLHYAVRSGWVGTVTTLLYYNADTSIRDYCGFTPIMYTITRHPDASERLIYEMLIGYEYNFSCSANGDPSVLSLALVTKSPYLDEMFSLGVDFSNLRRNLNILFWCIDQPDIEEFKWFWDIFDYEKSWIYRNSILEFLFRIEKYSAFDYVLESPKMEVVIEVQHRNEFAAPGLLDYDSMNYSPKLMRSYDDYLVGLNVITCKILDRKYGVHNKSKAEQVIFILLSYGYEACEVHADRIFEVYGYGPLFELLLHLDVETDKYRQWNLIRNPYLLLAEVLLEPSRDARNFVIQRDGGKEMEEEKKVEEAKKIEGAYVCDREVLFMGVGVPSLLELSRNQARVAIWNGYKIQNTKQFYTTVKWMDIPKVFKDILCLKLPVYLPREN